MMTKSIVALVASFILINAAFSQNNFTSEEELKAQAQKLFEERKLVEASPLFAQLLALYPQDPNYNYKYGATMLEASADREKPLKYLKFAISKSSQVEPLAYYFLGKAYHLNYSFADAVKYYSKFKQKADKELMEEFMVDRQIEMAKNGNQLLSKLNEVQVLDKQLISRKDFFRIYELEGINGKIIVKPEEFMTKYDQKIGERSVIYLPANAMEVYFSSYGKKGENGRDIFKTVKLGNRSWSEPVNLGPSINTPYDENYPFIHPDGRTLYFASKGHSSMGGYDLFMSTYDQSTAQWMAPVNLDFAFSSVDDDILFVTDKNKVLAYFASSRANEADDITVYKVMVEKAPADLSVIQGKFIAENNPNLKKAKITVIDSKTQQTVGIYNTDSDGKYQVEIASNGGLYRFNVETTSDAPIHTGEVEIPRQSVFEVLGQELRLVGEGDNQQLVIKNIFDGTAAQSSSGPSISSNTLRQKALLDINFSEDALAELTARRNAEQASIRQAEPKSASTDQAKEGEQLADNTSADEKQTDSDQNNSANGVKTAGAAAAGAGVAAAGINAGSTENKGAINGGKSSDSQSKDLAKEEELTNELNNLDKKISKRSKELTAQSAFAFQKASQLKSAAEKAFTEAGVDPSIQSVSIDQNANNGSKVDDSGETQTTEGLSADALAEKEKLRQARELASRAAITAALAQKLDAGANNIQELDQSYSSEQASISAKIAEGDYSTAQNQLSKINNQEAAVLNTTDYLNSYKNKLEQAIDEEKYTLSEDKKKLDGLMKENQRIDSTISLLEQKITQSENEGSPDEESQKQLEELKLDQEDIQFQLRSSQAKVSSQEREIAALELEKSELDNLSNELVSVDPNTTDISKPSASERDQLIADLKTYRDNEQLAYAATESKNSEYLSPSQMFVGGEFAESNAMITAAAAQTGINPSESDSRLSDSSSDLTAEIKSIDSIDEQYLTDINKAESLVDTDLQNARKIEVYDQWISDLDQQAQLRRSRLSQISDPAEKKRVQEELNQISRDIASKQSQQAAIKTSIAASGGAAIASIPATPSKNGAKPPSSVNNTTEPLLASGNQLESEEEKRVQELAASLGPVDIGEVEANSPFPEGINTFKFDKSYNYSADEVSPALKSVKISLYQANEYVSKADAARSAAYTLPTVDERKRAFEDVNKYGEASDLLQVQAMKDIGNVNQQEFFRNANILNNLNDYDDADIESNNLDMAILLQDEAETYFNNAQLIRGEVQSSSSTSGQRTKLQKAYDMEMLALNKQRQALESLKLVDADVQLAEENLNTSEFRNAQIQTITDPEILAIENANEARKEGDALVNYAEKVEVDAEQLRKSAEVETIGPKRDSLMQLYQAKQDSAIQLRSQAAVYYDREKQIESGFEAGLASDAGILKPALVFTQSYKIDTVNVDDERKNTLLESKEYKAFTTAAKDNLQLRRAARVEYDKAVDLRKKQFELDRQAQVLLASAAQTDNPSEKERRIKQARVIELKAERIDDSIDSLNKIIRVKNYLVTSSSDKMRQSIASLSATQQAEIIYLVNKEEVDILSTDLAYDDLALESETESQEQAVRQTAANDVAQNNAANTAAAIESRNIETATAAIPSSSSSTQAGEKPTQGVIIPKEEVKPQAKDLALSQPIPVTPRKSTAEEKKSVDGESEARKTNHTNKEVLDDGTVNPDNIIRSAPRRPISLANINRVPKKMDGPVFIKLGLNESAYGNDNPIPSLNELPEGLVYKVQVGAFRKPIPQDLFKGFAPLTSEKGPNGITRYTAGLFINEREAVGARDEIRNFGYKDAFVVAFRDGVRVSITAARNAAQATSEQLNKTGASSTEKAEVQRSKPAVDFGDGVKDLNQIDDLFFTVQIGVFSKQVKEGTFSNLQEVNAIQLPTGLIRYNSGIFNSLAEAESHKESITSNIADAFVVVYYKGKRISINEAARILNQN